MAYNAPTGDFVTSTLSGAITAIADSATIGTGLTIPATNGILQIDYDSTEALGAANGPETISYAAYDSGTGALTGMVRGLTNTTGVTHNDGASVQSGMSSQYFGTGSIATADIGDMAVTPAKIAAGMLVVTPNGPAAIAQAGQAQLTWTTENIETGIISSNAANDTFAVTSDCYATIDLTLGVTHTSTADTFHLYLTEDATDKGIIASAQTPASISSINIFHGNYKLLAGKTYKLFLAPNGASGSHTVSVTTGDRLRIVCIGA